MSGPKVDRGKLTVLGKYVDDALTFAGMSQSELARRAGLSDSSYLSRALKSEVPIPRETLLEWCAILQCPEWLAERILNAAGYATTKQQQAANELVTETHERILKEVKERKT